MIRTALLTLLLPLLAACAAAPGDSPEHAIDGLYSALREGRVTGAPSAEQLDRLAPFLSDTLRALLDGARRMRDADAAAYPDEKPAFADGDLFSSLFEGPTGFRVVRVDSGSPHHRARVEFTDERASPAPVWTDVVLVLQERGRWVVDDVEYGGNWDFAARGSLRHGLEIALSGQH
jgi:hypothetical protein